MILRLVFAAMVLAVLAAFDGNGCDPPAPGPTDAGTFQDASTLVDAPVDAEDCVCGRCKAADTCCPIGDCITVADDGSWTCEPHDQWCKDGGKDACLTNIPGLPEGHCPAGTCWYPSDAGPFGVCQ